MKKFVCSFLFFTLSLLTLHFALLTSVDAHILKTDGSIGAVLHIDPEDDPIIGEPATLFFELKDTQGKFSESECTCIATVFQDGQKVIAQSISNGVFTFTFPKKALYTITMSGTPISENSFQPFTLSYDLRVTQEGSRKENNTTIEGKSITSSMITVGAIIGVIGTIISMWPMRNRIKKLYASS